MPRFAISFACSRAWLSGSCETPGIVAMGRGASRWR